MANINKMEIVKTLSATGKITVKKGFLGLGTKVMASDNGVNMRAIVKEYTPAEGEKMLRIINMSTEQMKQALSQSKPEDTGLGNIKLEVLVSEDEKLLIMQMFKYADFKSNPISDMKTIAGNHAADIAKML